MRLPLLSTLIVTATVAAWGHLALAQEAEGGVALVLYAAPPSDSNAHAAVLLAASRADLTATGGIEARPLASTLFGDAVAWICDLADHSCVADDAPFSPGDLLSTATLCPVAVDDLVAELLYVGSWHGAMVERLGGLDRVSGATSVHLVDVVTGTVLNLDRVVGRLSPVLHPATASAPADAVAPRGPAGGPVLVVLGGLTAIVGLAAALDQRSQGLEIFAYVEQDPSTYDDSLAAYGQARRGMTSALIVAGVGGALAVTGVPVWLAEARRTRSTTTVALCPVALPGRGGGIWIEGRW